MAPGRTSVAEGFAAAHHLLLGHGLALERLRARIPDGEHGIVINFGPQHAATDSPADAAAAAVKDALFNRWFVEPIAGRGYPIDATGDVRWSAAEIRDGDLDIIAAPIDVLGVNYYTRSLIDAAGEHVATTNPATAMGWEIYPEGLAETLRWLHSNFRFRRYLVTENGAAMDDRPDASGFVDDQDRIDFLRRHLAVVHQLVDEGTPIGGYFAWSLMDNFEWAYGYTQRFGLIRVDYDTLARTPKASAAWYAGVAGSNAVV
jgi:beta-glucosidase